MALDNQQAHTTDLWCVARHLQHSPDFMAGWCTSRPGALQVLVAALDLDEIRASHLLVCRVPREDRYEQDVAAIADAINVAADALTHALTEAAVVAALLHRRNGPGASTLLGR